MRRALLISLLVYPSRSGIKSPLIAHSSVSDMENILGVTPWTTDIPSGLILSGQHRPSGVMIFQKFPIIAPLYQILHFFVHPYLI